MRKLVLSVFAMAIYTIGAGANGVERIAKSGNISFGGIQVKVALDESRSLFKVGESKFASTPIFQNGNLIYSAQKQVGISLGNETLTSTLYVQGENGNPTDFACPGLDRTQFPDITNARIVIKRTDSNRSEVILNDNCLFLEKDERAL